MSDEIKPALTPEEWRGVPRPGSRKGGQPTAEMGRYTVSLFTYDDNPADPGRELQVSCDFGQERWLHVPQELMYQAAALCLHLQPYGFTWEDVDLLRRSVLDEHGWDGGDSEALLGVADRLASLLPPREG